MSTMSHEEYKAHVSKVWQVTLILAFVTVAEVGIAIAYDRVLFPEDNRWPLNLFLIAASLFKAFYIVSVFMHMKYERQALALTVLVPFVFLIWFIIAFMWEGWAWLQNITNWMNF